MARAAQWEACTAQWEAREPHLRYRRASSARVHRPRRSERGLSRACQSSVCTGCGSSGAQKSASAPRVAAGTAADGSGSEGHTCEVGASVTLLSPAATAPPPGADPRRPCRERGSVSQLAAQLKRRAKIAIVPCAELPSRPWAVASRGTPDKQACPSRPRARRRRPRKPAAVRENPDTRATTVSVLAARLSRCAQNTLAGRGSRGGKRRGGRGRACHADASISPRSPATAAPIAGGWPSEPCDKRGSVSVRAACSQLRPSGSSARARASGRDVARRDGRRRHAPEPSDQRPSRR